MSLTKINWYMSMILVVGTIFISFLAFGNQLSLVYPSELSNNSYTYLDQYVVYLQNEGIITLAEADLITLQEDDVLTDPEGAQSITDFLATLNYYKSKIQKTNNYLRLVYHLPSLFILTLGLPIGLFTNVIAVLGVVLFIGFVVLIVRLVRGS